MVADLQFLDVSVSAPRAKYNSPSQYFSVPLAVGNDFKAGDLRLIFLTCTDYVNMGAGWSWTSNTGWTRVHPSTIPSYADYAVFYRVLQAGDADGVALGNSGWPPVTAWLAASVTVRNWDPAQSLSFTAATTAVNNISAPVNLSAPSQSVIAGSVVLCSYLGSFSPISQVPSGMLELAHSTGNGIEFVSDPNNDPSAAAGGMLCAQSYASSGSSGSKTALIQPTYNGPNTPGAPWTWGIATSVCLHQAPDLTFAIGAATETDTAGAITFANQTTQTFPIGPATETDTAGAFYTALQQEWTDWDILPGDPIDNTSLSWTVVPGSAGSTVTVRTSVDNRATWQVATNGGPIPNLTKGNTTATAVHYRVTFTRLNPGDTPPTVGDFWPHIAVDDSWIEHLPLGTFVINQQEVVESGGDGGGLVVTLTAPDYSYIISRRTWDDVYVVNGNTNVMDAIAQIARNRMPEVVFGEFGTTPHVLAGPMVFGSDQAKNDPWSDLMELAASIGFMIFFNVWGELCCRPIPDITIDSPVHTISDGSDGNRPTICGYTKTIDDFTTFSHVIAQGESTNNAAGLPVMAEWFNTDPASVTNVYSDFGDITTFYHSVLLGTTVQCQQAADAIGRFASGAETTLKVDHLPLAFLEPWDLVTVVRPLAGISGVYVFNGFIIPLEADGVQNSNLYRQLEAPPETDSFVTPWYPSLTRYPSPTRYPRGA